MEEELKNDHAYGKGSPYPRAQFTQVSIGTSDIDSKARDSSLSSDDDQNQEQDDIINLVGNQNVDAENKIPEEPGVV